MSKRGRAIFGGNAVFAVFALAKVPYILLLTAMLFSRPGLKFKESVIARQTKLNLTLKILGKELPGKQNICCSHTILLPTAILFSRPGSKFKESFIGRQTKFN